MFISKHKNEIKYHKSEIKYQKYEIKYDKETAASPPSLIFYN